VGGLRPSILAEVLRQFGVFAEGAVRPHGAFENDARLLHGRGDDLRIGALLRDTLMK
jgi:hypothetical protein